MSKPRGLSVVKAHAFYYLRAAWRRTNLLSWLVLLVALYISLALVVPALQAPLHAIGLNVPSLTHYEISGTIREAGSLEPASAVRVSVGGYSTVTDSEGRYNLEFSSDTSQDICVVVGDRAVSDVYFVDAGPDYKIVMDRVAP
jgi:hypothetical protein